MISPTVWGSTFPELQIRLTANSHLTISTGDTKLFLEPAVPQRFASIKAAEFKNVFVSPMQTKRRPVCCARGSQLAVLLFLSAGQNTMLRKESCVRKPRSGRGMWHRATQQRAAAERRSAPHRQDRNQAEPITLKPAKRA